MSLVKGTNVKQPKVKVLNTIFGYNIPEYLQFYSPDSGIKIFDNNIININKLKFKDIIIIQGDFSNWAGNIFLQADSDISTNMAIVKEGSVLEFTLGDELTEFDISSGTHIFGFANGKAFLDNDYYDFEKSSSWLDQYFINVDSDYKQGNEYKSICEGDNTYGTYKIQRIIIQTSVDGNTYSFYPVMTNGGPKIIEALTTERYLNLPEQITYSPSNVTYGVSIDDIKAVTGSKYRDLLAIITEDSGRSVQIGNTPVHDPYRLIKDGVTHNFAFCLQNVPIPSGASSNSSTAGYRKGELLYGRRPKWNIWANAIPYSVWNRPDTDYGSTYDPERKVYATYNILEHWGKNGYVDLTWFNNYCDSESNTPQIKFIRDDGTSATNITLYYHNGIVCNTANEQLMPGLCNDEQGQYYDQISNMFSNMLAENTSIYIYDNTFPDSSVWMKLGNLINWNASQVTQYNADKLNNAIPTMNQMIYGEVATLTHSFKTVLSVVSGNVITWVDVLIGYATEQTRQLQSTLNQNERVGNFPFVALSSNSDSSTQLKFRDGKIDQNHLFLYNKLRATGNEPIRLYNELLSAVDNSRNHIYEIDAIGSMALLKKPEEITATETPKEKDLVYLDKFIQPTSLKIKGKFDENQLHDLYDFARNKAYDMRNICTNNRISSEFSVNQYSGVDRKFRLIFMNTFRTTNPVNNTNFVHCDKLYDPNNNTPYYFFPTGILNGNGAKYCSRHYDFETEQGGNVGFGGIFIPFVLTTVDYSTYQKVIANYTSNAIYTSSPTLRIIAEVTRNINLQNGEYEIKKDRVAKTVIKRGDLSNYYLNSNIIYSDNNNYLGLDLNTNDPIYVAQISPEDLPIICEGSHDIYTDTTIKFWIQNNSIASTILKFDNSFKYQYKNDSWYKCVFGSSLYIFIKDLQNNEWMNNEIDIQHQGSENHSNVFDLTASHWFYGKKVNLFRYSSSAPSVPYGGTYESPTSGVPDNWKDGLVQNINNEKLYMIERFYAKCYSPSDTSTNSYAYTHYIETNVFTDQQWSQPVEIKDDVDDQYVKVVLICQNSGDISTVIANPLQYIKYVENDGFYGVKKGNITTYVFKALKSSNPTASEEYSYYPCYYDENDQLITVFAENGSFTAAGRIYTGSGFSNWSKFSNVIELYFTTNLTLVSKEAKPYTTIYDFKTSDLNNYTTQPFPSTELDDEVQYKIKQKYMFSKTSSLTPSDEPGKWDSLSTATASSSATDYKFMYSEYYIFDIYGTFYKVFNLIQITGDLNEDNFYPVLLKDRDKLKTACSIPNDGTVQGQEKRDRWYKVGGSGGINIGEWNISSKQDEILAPYKINNLNVSIKDIVQVKIRFSDPNFKIYGDHVTFDPSNLTYRDSQTSTQYFQIDRVSTFGVLCNDEDPYVINYYTDPNNHII